MVPILVDGPAVEPVSLSEMRTYLRLADDDGAEDAVVTALLKAARLAVEAASGRVLVESRWRLDLAAWPVGRVLRVPPAPLIAVDSLAILANGTAVGLDPSFWRFEAGSDPARVIVDFRAPAPGPGEVIELVFRAGYGSDPASVPEPLRQAVRALAARWFENRGDGEGGAGPGFWPEILALVAPFRTPRL